jgi:hypothetical protein
MFIERLVGGITIHKPLGLCLHSAMACMYPVVFDPFDLVCSNADALHIVFMVRIRTEWVPSYD